MLNTASQEDVYSTCAADAVEGVLAGLNGTIFCFGQVRLPYASDAAAAAVTRDCGLTGSHNQKFLARRTCVRQVPPVLIKGHWLASVAQVSGSLLAEQPLCHCRWALPEPAQRHRRCSNNKKAEAQEAHQKSKQTYNTRLGAFSLCPALLIAYTHSAL